MKGTIYERVVNILLVLAFVPIAVMIVMSFLFPEITARLWALILWQLTSLCFTLFFCFSALFLEQINNWDAAEKKDALVVRLIFYSIAGVLIVGPIWTWFSNEDPMYVTPISEFAASQNPDTWYTVSGTVRRTPSDSVTGRVSGGVVVIETKDGDELETNIGFFPALERGEHYEFVLSANGKYILDVVR